MLFVVGDRATVLHWTFRISGIRANASSLEAVAFRFAILYFVDMSYRTLKVWQLAREVSIEVHEMTMKLPRFELYETGSQIRRSSKSTRAATVEGYGRRMYKQDWIRYLIIAISSNDETLDHLETLWERKSLTDEVTYQNLNLKIQELGRTLNKFIAAVERQHISGR